VSKIVILRLSLKLAARVKTRVTVTLPLDANPLADWSAHEFIAYRTPYILVTNTASLYSVVTRARGVSTDSDLVSRALECIGEQMADDNVQAAFLSSVKPSGAVVSFAKALNRSVTGSMNDLVFHAKIWLTEGNLSPNDAATKLNGIPFSALKYLSPREILTSLTRSQ